MTVAAAYLTSEGVVLGADSTASVCDSKGNTLQTLNHAQKVFEVGTGTQLGLATCGDGAIGGVPHRTIAAMLGDRLKGKPHSVEDAAKLLLELCKEFSIDASGQVAAPVEFVGYLLGGIDPSHKPRLYWVRYIAATDDKGKSEVVALHDRIGPMGPYVVGMKEYWYRIFHGFDDSLFDRLLESFKKELAGADELLVEAVFTSAWQNAIPELKCDGVDGMDIPIREAIDRIHACISATVKGYKLRLGMPPCGGPAEIAYISTDRPFRWARHKSFDSAIMEHEAKP